MRSLPLPSPRRRFHGAVQYCTIPAHLGISNAAGAALAFGSLPLRVHCFRWCAPFESLVVASVCSTGAASFSQRCALGRWLVAAVRYPLGSFPACRFLNPEALLRVTRWCCASDQSMVVLHPSFQWACFDENHTLWVARIAGCTIMRLPLVVHGLAQHAWVSPACWFCATRLVRQV